MKSPLTTIFGAVACVGGAILAACIPGGPLQGIINPQDIPQWLKMTAFLCSVGGGKLAFFFAQDTPKPSEDVVKEVSKLPILLFIAALALFACAMGCATSRVSD
ncbi:MAG: hypothetical protein JWM68_231 [Verrucomicrobiales bacterium]|nr:hypothetical protein [Verrucomicrobiales bacterium]